MKIETSAEIKKLTAQGVRLALSVRQPYAELILRDEKKFEYRTISTVKRNKRVFLYASTTPANDPWSWSKLDQQAGHLGEGTLIGTVEIVGCTKCTRCPILKSAQVRILEALAAGGPQPARQLADAATNGHLGWLYNFIGSKDCERDMAKTNRCGGSTLLGRKFVRLKRDDVSEDGKRSAAVYEITKAGRKAVEKKWYRWKLANWKRLDNPIKPSRDRRPNAVFFRPF